MNVEKDTTLNPVRSGHKVVGTAKTKITAETTSFVKGVVILADSDNSAPVYVGGANVTADSAETSGGFPLEAGKSLSLQVEDLSKVFAVSTAADQGVAWIGV